MDIELAIAIAASLKEICVGVYIFTEEQSPDEFIRAINHIKYPLEKIKQTGDYANPVKIILKNIDEGICSARITHDLIEAEEKGEGCKYNLLFMV